MENKTASGLMAAFSSECMDYVKYGYYAHLADCAGDAQTAAVFRELAGNEHEHALIWLKMLVGEQASMRALLLDAIKGERLAIETYVRLANDAEADGEDELAELYTQVGEIEKGHEKLLNKLLNALDGESKKPASGKWKCGHCGFVVSGDRPAVCPVCGASGNDFKPID